jgi:hypothetical protein
MYKYRNGCPNVKWVPQGGKKLRGKLMKGGGPIGEFLYEVGEMKIGSQMGKLMVDEMEGSWSCGGAGKTNWSIKRWSGSPCGKASKMRRRSMWLSFNMITD